MIFILLLAGLACCPFAFPALWQKRWVKVVAVLIGLYLVGGAVSTRHGAGYLATSLESASLADEAKAKALCDKLGNARIGMTGAQLRATCWGDPLSTKETKTAGGALEQWAFPLDSYVYLMNGVVTAITTRRDAEKWKVHRYTADGFQVEFSGQVSVTETKASAETHVARSTGYLQEGDTFVYIVRATLYTSPPNLESASNGGNAIGECKTIQEKTIAMAGADQSLEFDGGGCKFGRLLTRYGLKGKWLYQILAILPDDADSEDARHFIETLRLF